MEPFRAVVCASFGGPEVLKVEERAALGPPGPGQVLVKIFAAGVNPSDTYVRLGPAGPYASNPQLLPALPYTPGKDGAGVVEAVGEGVKLPGTRVYITGAITGTCAEYALCPADSVYPLPECITFNAGACIGVPCATAYRALFLRCKVVAGDTVLVHGASGAVGLAAVQLAVAAGCTVVGSAGTEAGLAAVRAAGATAAVCHRTEGYLDEAVAANGGKKFHVVLEMAAHNNLVADLSVIATGGILAIIGSKVDPVALNPRLLMAPEISVMGVFLGTATTEEKAETHRALHEAMSSGKLTPVVGSELKLEDAPLAHAEVMAPSSGGKSGNIVIVVRPEEKMGH